MLELNKIYCMDCLEGMKQLDDNSVDSIVTDPPYGLVSIQKRFGKANSAPAQYGKDGSFARLSKGFMGKEWDGTGIQYNVELWKEALRVLKPGGHLLAFGGTRTYHRMACAIEDAGFEIRDQIQWIYGSGFPKSLDISKAIDKKFGAKRGRKEFAQSSSWREKEGREDRQITVPDNNPITFEAKQWQGWGTALKPANEPICVARKPLSEGTVAENVLKWGTGGINIDECRISLKGEKPPTGSGKPTKTFDRNAIMPGRSGGNGGNVTSLLGRFPANVILDEEAGRLLDEQSGISKGSSKPRKNKGTGNICYGDYKTIITQNDIWGDKGGASRFFYCAKASKGERGEGNNHPTVKPIKLIEYLVTLVTPKGGICLDPFEGSGTHALACMNLGVNYIGFELSPEYCDIAEKRIAAHAAQLRLF